MPRTETVIEYPAAGATYCRPEYGVYRYGTYPEGSVLEGQESRAALGSYATLDEAQSEHPEARWDGGGSGYREITIPAGAPAWFDEAAAGERWDEE
jgi:hypothetical protein